jgi:hypothetical protein
MNWRGTREGQAKSDQWRGWDWAAASVLFFATAAVVVWQNLHVGVLWDLSYILENAHRISLGDFPYRDFPFPYAPGTFLVQAIIIKLGGRVFFHHIIYSAVVGGMATVLAWRVLLNVLRRSLVPPRLVAFLLSAPLTVLGIYCIYPHPFYDPDCTFAILACIYLLQQLERTEWPPLRAFLTGAALIVPLFIKQNVGLGFLGSVGLAIAVLMGIASWRRQRIFDYLSLALGSAVTLGVAALLLHLTVGLGNYWHWTIQFAAARRTPSLEDMFGAFMIHAVWWWIAAFACGALLLQANSQNNLGGTGRLSRLIALASVSLMSAPFVWPVIYLFLDDDSSERAERLLALWPFVLIVSFGFALFNLRRQSGIAPALPFVVIGTVLGAFLSQQLWGSTYALWPLLMILAAFIFVSLGNLSKRPHAWEMRAFAFVVAVSMLVSGGFYAFSHERLAYANVSDGEIARSTLRPLAGLSVRGPWIPWFEELVRFSDREIPRGDGLLMIPGEDLFYYTTGRHPRFPVIMFDHTVNPYSPEEILDLARARDIRWLVVKRNLQLEDQPVEDKDRLLGLLRQDFKQVAHLNNYDVYKRQ